MPANCLLRANPAVHTSGLSLFVLWRNIKQRRSGNVGTHGFCSLVQGKKKQDSPKLDLNVKQGKHVWVEFPVSKATNFELQMPPSSSSPGSNWEAKHMSGLKHFIQQVQDYLFIQFYGRSSCPSNTRSPTTHKNTIQSNIKPAKGLTQEAESICLLLLCFFPFQLSHPHERC